MGYPRRQEDEVARRSLIEILPDLHRDITFTQQDDLFLPVNMRGVAYFSRVEGGHMYFEFAEQGRGPVEDLPPLSFFRLLNGQRVPVDEEGSSGAGAPVGVHRRTGLEFQDIVGCLFAADIYKAMLIAWNCIANAARAKGHRFVFYRSLQRSFLYNDQFFHVGMRMGGMGHLAGVDGRSMDLQVGEIMCAPVEELPAIAARVLLWIEAFPAVDMRP